MRNPLVQPGKLMKRSSALLPALCVYCVLMTCAQAVEVSVLTQHNDPQRTGANLSETLLTPASVATPKFVRLGAFAVEGQVYAQPLYASRVSTDQKGVRNILFIATASNMLYAFDADIQEAPLPIWTYDAGRARTASSRAVYNGQANIDPEIGIIGTPVIDIEHSTIYLVAMTQPDRNRREFFHTLHAVDIRSGQVRGTPVTIEGSIEGGGQFNSAHENQRAALALVGDRVIISWAGFADQQPYDGFVMSYGTVDSSTGLKKRDQFQVVRFNPLFGERHRGGGIWHSGGGPAIDERAEFIYVVTGNGTSRNNHAGEDFDSSDVKLDASLRVADYYTPSYQNFLNEHDLDLSVSGPMIPPEWRDKTGKLVRRLVHGGKAGLLYNLNRDGLGRFHEKSNVPQQFRVFDEPNPGPMLEKLHIHATPTLWDRKSTRLVYVASDWGLGVKAFKFNDDGTLDERPLLFTSGPHRYAFTQLALSANGGEDGILWAIGCLDCVVDGPTKPNTDPGGKQGVLVAYDASKLGAPIFTSPPIGIYPRFNAPTVVNGRVYVPTFSNSVAVFGLTRSIAPPLAPAPVILEPTYYYLLD